MRQLTFGMNLSPDGCIAAPGDDLSWSLPSHELFQWWSDRVEATGLARRWSTVRRSPQRGQRQARRTT